MLKMNYCLFDISEAFDEFFRFLKQFSGIVNLKKNLSLVLFIKEYTYVVNNRILYGISLNTPKHMYIILL